MMICHPYDHWLFDGSDKLLLVTVSVRAFSRRCIWNAPVSASVTIRRVTALLANLISGGGGGVENPSTRSCTIVVGVERGGSAFTELMEVTEAAP